MILIRNMLMLSLLFSSPGLLAAEPSMGPVIENYGPTFPVDDRDLALPGDFVYRVVFDVAESSGDVASVNRNLVSVARYLNMHARNGVPVENMDIAVVIHGRALQSVLSDQAYETRHRIGNPNAALLQKLHQAGVRFYVCGQSMYFGRIKKSELAEPVELALSAMTMMTVLQSEGYALLP